MNFYVMLALLVVGGIELSFFLAFSWYYDEQETKILSIQCTDMGAWCERQPILSQMLIIGLAAYLIFACQQVISYENPNKKVNK